MKKFFEKIQKQIGLEGFVGSNKKDKHNRYRVKNQNYQKVLIYRAPFIFTCNQDNKLICLEDSSIIIEGGIIKEVLNQNEIEPIGREDLTNIFRIKGEGQEFDLIYDAGKRGGSIITPGFINGHTHSPMYLMRSAMLIDETDTVDQTISAMPRWEQAMNTEDLLISTIGDITEQQKYGVTTSLSHYGVFDAIEYATHIVKHNMINALSAVSNSHPENNPSLIRGFLKNKDQFKSQLAVALHYLYKASDESLKEVSRLVNDNDLLFTCHMAESPSVSRENFRKFGMGEVSTLEKFGLLRDKSVISHGIYLSDDEIVKACQSKLGIVHLPTSNAIHKSGTFPFWKFYDAGGFDRIILGTDSVVSKSRLDILTEAYQTRLTHLYSRTVKFGSLFKMMTVNGARVLHLSDRGRILPGMKADLAFWKLKDRGLVPFDKKNPVTLIGNMITHNGTIARDLMINGRFVIKNRKHLFVNESRLLELIQDRHMELRARIEKIFY